MIAYLKSLLRKILPAYRVACDVRSQVAGVAHEISVLKTESGRTKELVWELGKKYDEQGHTNELILELGKKYDELNEYLRGTLLYAGGVSYAQHGEDMLIRYLLNTWGVEKSYIDLGCHHPYALSNTAVFYHDGWKGINVEANPVLAALFYSARPKDVNLCVGVGGQEGNMTFYMFNDHDPRNGFDKKLVDVYLKENPAAQVVKEINVPIKTIQNILDEYNHGESPSFMSIDIEGLEYDALRGFNLREHGPIICDMEISQNKDDLIQLMQNAGYFLYVKAGANYIWIRDEYKSKIVQ